MAGPLFESRPEIYEALIDWPKRLANEGPFFQALFEQLGARHVLDVACGTGQHAVLFHSWGLAVEGADISPAMIERCRRQQGESDLLRWVVRRFDAPVLPPGGFDVAVCLGNSLALARDHAEARGAVAAMLAAVRPGGVCVVQLLNLWQIPDGPCVWQKFRRVWVDGQELLLIKGVHRYLQTGLLEFLAVPLAAGDPVHETVRLTGLECDDLLGFARAAGARRVEFLGSYGRDAYQRERSGDLIALIERA
jgi:SAM-dependent methyltransferase